MVSKISDPAAFEIPSSCGDAVSDLHWLVSRAVSGGGDPKHPACAWQALSVLTRLAARSARIRSVLRSRLRAPATLTDLLLALPATCHERRAKVLDLLRHVACGAKVYRMEAFLRQLLPRLVQ